MNKLTLTLALAAGLATFSAHAGEIILVNEDVGTGLGLDDPRPVKPVGANPGKTLGEQRRLVYQFAAASWGSMLQSNVPVFVSATFQPLACTPTSGTLGSAGTNFVFSDFAGAPLANTWYHSALADAISGVDLAEGEDVDIVSRFNGDIGVNPNCLTGSDWYYGLDGKTPVGSINFLNVVMHEIGHGLGFSAFMSTTSGAPFFGLPDVYMHNSFNNTLGKGFEAMTNAERQAAVKDTGNTVWTGAAVTSAAPGFLSKGAVLLKVTAPTGVVISGFFGTASFGAVATSANFNKAVVLGDDGVGATADACEPLINGAALAGKIAIVDRGVCGFAVKAKNVQDAGAVGVIIANNQAGGAIGLGGTDPTVTIPAISVSQADGVIIKAALPATLAIVTDLTRLQGADSGNHAQLYAPATVAPGSTYSHFDTALTPNAVMEPFITDSLRADVNVDLTPALLRDIGWSLQSNAKIEKCDTSVKASTPTGVAVGASLAGMHAVCDATSKNHGAYTVCMLDYTKSLYSARLLTPAQFSQAFACASKSSGGK